MKPQNALTWLFFGWRRIRRFSTWSLCIIDKITYLEPHQHKPKVKSSLKTKQIHKILFLYWLYNLQWN